MDITPSELRPNQGLADSVTDGWAEPAATPSDISVAEWRTRRRVALLPYNVDGRGWPLNPTGRTGRTGRNLGRWGENAAADPIVVACAGKDRHMLLIRRADCGQWAIPGGHVDPGETAPAALVRELREETGVDLSDIQPMILARVHVHDPRETDHAWIATTAALYRIPRRITAVAGDDAADARWWPFGTLEALASALADTGGQPYEAHRSLFALVEGEV